MMNEKPRAIAYDDDWWPEPYPMAGSLHSVSGEPPEAVPVILVPDGAGDYREHVAAPSKRRLGF